MKRIFKKILTAVCALTLCIVCLTGCSWLKINNKSYYDQLVVSVDGIDFYKSDLLEAFNSYGYKYYQNGSSMQESVEATINTMIEKELLLIELKEMYGNLSDPEMLEVKKEAFDFMQDSIFTFEDKVREEWGMVAEDEHDHSEDKAPLRKTKTEYTPSTEYKDGKVVIYREKDDYVITDNLPEHFTKDYQIITEEKVSNEAWSRYVKKLQDEAEEKGRNTSEKQVLLYEEERLIKTITDNRYLEKYEDSFYSNLELYKLVLEEYKRQYKSQHSLFTTENVGEDYYHTAMQKASSEYMYYHVNSGNEYINVKHILVNFTEEQKNEIKTLNTLYGIKDDNTDEDELRKQNTEYLHQLNEIIKNTKTTTDEYNGKTEWTFEEVYDYVKSYVKGSNREKSIKFDELVYVFNDDEGFMNSEFDYVVNIDPKVKDQMVKPFANGVRKLHNEEGGQGAINYIVSTYGYHIIFHDGVAKNIVDEYNIDNISDANLLNILCNTYTTPNSNKTIFNYLYDKLGLADLAESKYNEASQEIIDASLTEIARKGETIKYYENNYKDLWK